MTFTLSPKVSPKWITRTKNKLRRWEKDHIEAKNMFFHLTYLGNLYQIFLDFSENEPLPYRSNFLWNG